MREQTKTEKILWGIFDLLKTADDLLNNPLATWRLYDNFYRGGYGEIIRKIGWRKSRHDFAKFIGRLKQLGYLKTVIQKDKKAIILTPKALEKILKLDIEKSDKKKRRDGKWQMIIWDIPENFKKTRERFRTALRLLGYQQLQKSVWVNPYDVEKQTEKLIRFYGVESYTKLFLISEMKI